MVGVVFSCLYQVILSSDWLDKLLVIYTITFYVLSFVFFTSPLSRYPGVPADIQEENGIQYKFEVYQKSVLAQ